MVKLLIADDESFTRQGILETIPWKALNISEVREAYDGQNALEIIKDFLCIISFIVNFATTNKSLILFTYLFYKNVI